MAEHSKPYSKCIENEDNSDEFLESRSNTQIKIIKLKHTWTINDFSSLCKKTGEYLESSTFSAGTNSDKSEWYLKLYPKGDNAESSDYVGLFLVLKEFKIGVIKAKCNLSISSTKGENVISFNDSRIFKIGSGRGWRKFVTREFLFNEDNEALPGDKLTIICEISATVGSEDISETLSAPQNNPPIDFTFLLENKQFSDVTLSTGGKEFPAHKIILIARSPVFRAMFQTDLEESRNNRVEITDIDDEGLGELLRFMYTGKVNKWEEMAPILLGMAEKYDMHDLKIMCEEVLFKSLTLKNVAEIFVLSDKFRAIELKMQVKEYIAAHASAVVNSSEFQSVIQKYPHLSIEAFCALNGN